MGEDPGAGHSWRARLTPTAMDESALEVRISRARRIASFGWVGFVSATGPELGLPDRR